MTKPFGFRVEWMADNGDILKGVVAGFMPWNGEGLAIVLQDGHERFTEIPIHKLKVVENDETI